ncbi:hypothetical protein AWB72_02858 [Caballeronia concitans]|uniref:Uncharacterized protein n=1 Tax=Caballeronia concitans TaxID=1777133 RepID=A0A658QXT4_9BURK|nr:hypothetical protein BurMR1_5148 [Burkholderia sp. MR1]SAL31960.1 hypothetical protein AWB72_02858 [Caballeronia concitans]
MGDEWGSRTVTKRGMTFRTRKRISIHLAEDGMDRAFG